MTQTELPRLRPYAFGGKAYSGELRAINKARLWSTNVYPAAQGGAAKAAEAAVELEGKATARMEEIERLRVALRRCFRDNDNDN